MIFTKSQVRDIISKFEGMGFFTVWESKTASYTIV